MQRIGEATVRAFKTLAGLEQDEPASSWVYAIYTVLFLFAFALVVLWLLPGPA